MGWREMEGAVSRSRLLEAGPVPSRRILSHRFVYSFVPQPPNTLSSQACGG